MARATRSSDPIDLPGNKSHGLSGFNHGCGCLVCRAAKRDAQQRFKDKRRGVNQPPEGAPKGAGKQEQLTWAEIEELGELNAEQASLAHVAMINAKLIDTIEKESRWHLLNATTRSLRETMKELRGTMRQAKPQAEGEDDDLELQGFG